MLYGCVSVETYVSGSKVPTLVDHVSSGWASFQIYEAMGASGRRWLLPDTVTHLEVTIHEGGASVEVLEEVGLR